jgi:hypothetical protein
VTDWAAVLAGDFAVPAGESVDGLRDELCAMLTSPDPAVRDDTAHTVLAFWLMRGVFDGALAPLGDRMAATLAHEDVQARTFAALILAHTVLRDAVTGELDATAVPRWRAAFARWWCAEPDLRG